VLELIASQAAISLRHAQLYGDLQHENDQRRKAEIELRQSTDALSHLQEEMRQASRVAMMGELTASLAHELNQPLGGILINAQTVRRLLTAKKPDLAEVKAAIEEIINDNSRAVDIIRNVRSLFLRDDAQMQPVDLKQVLLDAGRMLAADAALRDVTLRSNLPASLPIVIGNRTQLLQALVNLVLNAFDAVCEDGIELRDVEISASEPEPGQVRVAVSDSGKGIDPEIMPRLFDAFFTTKAHGLGMGLAIVRTIVENHGGRLWATRNSGGGATLEFELPVKDE
jgi:C4-dicarboxylate-specific signal transduction histidine kinase